MKIDFKKSKIYVKSKAEKLRMHVLSGLEGLMNSLKELLLQDRLEVGQ